MSQMISIIIPVYNEAGNIEPLLGELYDVLDQKEVFEIIFIDDGSRDGTLALLKECASRFNNLYYISFSNNFGHQNALRAGLEASRGDAVVSIDGDLQHPPQLIPQMIAHWREGYDVVYTSRQNSDDIGAFKKFSSRCFYAVINLLSKVEIKNGSADFRLLDRKVVDALKQIGENDIFYRGIIPWIGFRQYELSYVPQQRYSGISKYSFYKMIRLGLTGITSFSVYPLRISAMTGFIIAGFSFVYALYAFVIKLFSDDAVSGWASIMTGIYFLGGIQLIAIGICGEYIGRILLEVKKRPSYVIADSYLPPLQEGRNCQS